MKYQWDLNELRNNKKELENLYKSTKNFDRKLEIQNFINLYKEMIDMTTRKYKKENSLLNDSDSSSNMDDLIIHQINEYETADLVLLNSILQSYIPFKTIHPIDFELREIPVITTNEQIMTITKHFFHTMTPPDIEKKFLDLLVKQNIIHISYNDHTNYYAGVTLMDSILNKKYIYISRNNILTDIINFPHESFHYIFMDYETYLARDYNAHYTIEIDGCFANILFGDYFYQNETEEKNFFNEHNIEIFNSTITSIVVRNCFLESLTNKKHFRFNKFNKMISTYELKPFEKSNDILEYINTSLDVEIKYSLGFLASIDLYYIYQKDPDLAFYLLKNIRYITHENDVLGLLRRNHITFMDDDCENLKKYIKKIESQR